MNFWEKKYDSCVKLESCEKEDYHYIYDLVAEFFKTNLNVMYMKLDSYEEFFKKAYVKTDKSYIVKNRIDDRVGYVHILDNGEIGYFIDSEYQRMGWGTEAVKILMELNPRTNYFASINLNNKASLKVIEKLGFKPKATVWDKVTLR